MAIFHLSTKPISRSSGRSAVAAAAYRTQSLLVDERQGLTHDYERRSGVEHAEIVLPEAADREHWTRQQLWNAAEFAEVRKDARTAREWELALPDELSAEARQKLAVGFAGELASRYGCAVDVAIHAPGKEGDHRNHHAHLLATTRVVVGSSLGEKVAIELSDAKRLSLGLGQGRQEIEQVRALWAERTNEALEKQGIEQKIDHRSLNVQRLIGMAVADHWMILQNQLYSTCFKNLEGFRDCEGLYKASLKDRRRALNTYIRQLRQRTDTINSINLSR